MPPRQFVAIVELIFQVMPVHVCMSIANILLKHFRYLLFVHIVPLIMHPLFTNITHSHSTASVAMFMLKRANPNLPFVFSVLSMSGSNGPTQRERIDGLVADMEKQSQLLNSTARLCLQTSHRQQSDTTRRSLVCFVKSDLRLSVLDRWHTWNKNAKLPPAERPTPPPPPLREQIGNLLCTYLLEQAEMLDIPQATLGVIKMLGKALEAITIIPDKDKEGDVQPVLLLFRPSETSMFVREALLDPVWAPVCGKSKDIGFRPARLSYSGPHKAVMEQLGLPTQAKGSGKSRRSPKREAEAGASPKTQRSRQRT
jgi:hypothetical protein